jgi:hypothetical protein
MYISFEVNSVSTRRHIPEDGFLQGETCFTVILKQYQGSNMVCFTFTDLGCMLDLIFSILSSVLIDFF